MDLDAQGNASTGLGVPKDEREKSTYDLLTGKAGVKDVVKETNIPSLFIAPASTDLSSIDDEESQRSRSIRGQRGNLSLEDQLRLGEEQLQSSLSQAQQQRRREQK